MDPRKALKKWRAKRTLADAGGDIGCDPSLLRKIENGVRRPGLDLAVRIRDAIGIPVEAWKRARKRTKSGELAAVQPTAEPTGTGNA